MFFGIDSSQSHALRIFLFFFGGGGFSGGKDYIHDIKAARRRRREMRNHALWDPYGRRALALERDMAI